jgi:hypothetical protein
LDVYVGLAARSYLRKYYNMTNIPRSDSVSTLWHGANRNDFKFFENMIEKCIFFSQGFPISSTNIKLGIDKAETSLRIQRQFLIREQCILEVVLRMINRLIPITDRLDKIKNAPTKKKIIVSEAEQSVLNMGRKLLGQCFELLYYCISDNPENQIYVADHMPVLLAHLSSQELAGKSVTEMLSKNVELQETKIGTREIQIFVDKLRSSKMNAMYLQLLQACCSCEGDGIDANQGNIATMLFSNTNDIIISVHADYSRITKVDWHYPSLYIPLHQIPGSPIRGDVLYLKGIPQLSLSWTTNSIDYSPLGLFGKLSVNVEELFRILDAEEIAALKKIKSAKKRQAAEQKDAVAKYFIAEMFLGAEMCLDRNYICYEKLDPIFSFEMLLTMMKINVSTTLKSAAVRLLLFQYVDRDPQGKSKIPRLTRTWSDIASNPIPPLPYVEAARRYNFALIQQLISEHVKSMANTNWDEYSRHMLLMLRFLCEFNFYGSNDRMTDVIGPLIKALDRRQTNRGDKMVNTSKDTKEDENNNGEIAADEAGDALSSAFNDDKLKESESKKDAEITEAVGNTGTAENDDDDKKESANALSILTSCFSGAGRMNTFLDKSDKENGVGFQEPLRYSKAPIYELETMVEAVDILAFVQTVIEDRNLSLLLRYFYLWETKADSRTPPEIFEQVVIDSKQLTLDIADFDNVMIDVLMYVHTPLIQSTLEVLMAHHSLRQTLFANARSCQLLQSHGRERQFKIVDQMLQQMYQNAETHEIWGSLEKEEHYAVNKQIKDILKELTEICRIRRVALEFDEDYMADTDIQDLYRNLGLFDICMKILSLSVSVEEGIDEDGNLVEAAANTKDLCLMTNNLLYWFFLGNHKNQELGYNELEYFLENLDSEINCHLIIRAIFKDNEYLMRQVQHSHLADLVERIIKDGKSHHYLSLFASITNVGDKNIVENQFEIVRSLTSPGRLHKVACFLVPVDHPDYKEKRELMKPFLEDHKDVTLDELPPLLAYHLMFLEVLSGCTIGRKTLTSIEAKVQSVYNYVDVIQSILDEGTITCTKIRLCKFLYNSIIEVELKVPGLDQSIVIWNLLESFKIPLLTAKETILHCEKYFWGHPLVSRQSVEYVIVCIMIIQGFFVHYYNPAAFQSETEGNHNHNNVNNSTASASAIKFTNKVSFSLSHIDELILYFFVKISEIYEMHSKLFSEVTKKLLHSTLEILSKKSNTTNLLEVKSLKAKATTTGSAAVNNDNIAPVVAADYLNDEIDDLELVDDPEQKLIESYHKFLDELESDERIKYQTTNENVAFISILEKLPFEADPVESDVRYETLIKKLVSHIRENIEIVDNQKRLDPRVSKTSAWIIRAFRTMIENRMGMSIYERDEDGGKEQDEAAAPVVNALNSCGATVLCLDLIADGIDDALQLEAIKLGVGLLFKEGGAMDVQSIMNNHLMMSESSLFFKQVRITIQKLQEWHTWNEIIILKEGEEPAPPDEILLLRFLQLMCEGHYLPNQDIMREQPNNPVSYNLLDDFVSYLNCLSRLPCRTSSTAAIRLSATILEVIQGPCSGNQAHFALSTELIETLNRVNRTKQSVDCIEEEEIEMKQISIDIFQGLLEGQGSNSPVFERILSVMHLDIIQMMSKGLFPVETSLKEECTEQEIILQTECVVLLQILCNYKPSLYDELGISRNIEDIVGSGTAMIEVIWRGDIHRRFFHIPKICDFLSKVSKDNLVSEVDRSNSENKLIDFLTRSHELYLEVKHQQLLTELGISGIFSRRVQDRTSWLSFSLALAINILLLVFYYVPYLVDDTGKVISTVGLQFDVHLPPKIEEVIKILCIIQIVVAFLVIVLWLVVRIPVKYQYLQSLGYNPTETIIYSATDVMTLYYVWYFAFSIMGRFFKYDFLPFLLLDIVVKDSTTLDVLNAVIFPRKQLAMGTVIIFCIVQIYAFFYVSIFVVFIHIMM